MEKMILEEKLAPIVVAKSQPKIDGSSVDTIILLVRNPSFGNILKPYDINILGKKMWEWVAAAVPGKITTTTCTEETDILNLIRPFLGEAKFTLVLYSDTPLLTAKTINDIIIYATARNMNVLKLARGYVFNTEWAKQATNIFSSATQNFTEEEFFIINSCSQLPLALDVLKKRILNHFMKTGVVIYDPASTFIDAESMIESGVVIYPNNIIKGKSLICKNTILESNNIIENSIILENCKIAASVISNEKIPAESKIIGKK